MYRNYITIDHEDHDTPLNYSSRCVTSPDYHDLQNLPDEDQSPENEKIIKWINFTVSNSLTTNTKSTSNYIGKRQNYPV